MHAYGCVNDYASYIPVIMGGKNNTYLFELNYILFGTVERNKTMFTHPMLLGGTLVRKHAANCEKLC